MKNLTIIALLVCFYTYGQTIGFAQEAKEVSNLIVSAR